MSIFHKVSITCHMVIMAILVLAWTSPMQALDSKEGVVYSPKHHYKYSKKQARQKKHKMKDRQLAEWAKAIGLTQKQYQSLRKHHEKFGKTQHMLKRSIKKVTKQLNDEMTHPYPNNKHLKKYRKTRDKLIKKQQKLNKKISASLRQFLTEAQALQFQKEMAKKQKAYQQFLKKKHDKKKSYTDHHPERPKKKALNKR